MGGLVGEEREREEGGKERERWWVSSLVPLRPVFLEDGKTHHSCYEKEEQLIPELNMRIMFRKFMFRTGRSYPYPSFASRGGSRGGRVEGIEHGSC